MEGLPNLKSKFLSYTILTQSYKIPTMIKIDSPKYTSRSAEKMDIQNVTRRFFLLLGGRRGKGWGGGDKGVDTTFVILNNAALFGNLLHFHN